MSFTVSTNSQLIFSPAGSYYAWATLSYTNNGDRTFTVSVDSVSATCNYGWNFGSYIDISLGGSSKSVKISSSGSNNYKGSLSTSVGFKKTFSYNDDGTAPYINFSISASNAGIYDIKTGKTNALYVSGSTNISSHIKSISVIDNSSPKITLELQALRSDFVRSVYINFKAKSSSKATNWEYRLLDSDGKNVKYFEWNEFADYSLNTPITEASGSTDIPHHLGEYSIQVRARKSSNGIYGYSDVIKFSLSNPTIENAYIDVINQTAGKLHFKCDFKCDYQLVPEGEDKDKIKWISSLPPNTDPNKDVLLSPNVEKIYTLYVAERMAYTWGDGKLGGYMIGLFNRVPITVDTRLPSIEQLYFTPDSMSSGNLYIGCNYAYQWRYKLDNSIWSNWSDTIHSNIKDTRRLDVTHNGKSTVQVELRRSDCNNLIVSKTLEVDTSLPDIKNIAVKVVEDGRANIRFTSGCDFAYRYHNGTWSSWSNVIPANTTTNIDLTVKKDFKSDITLQVRRASSEQLTTSVDLIVDSRLPHIENANLTVTSDNTATLSYVCDLNTKYNITTDKNFGGELSAGLVLNRNISIIPNKSTTYKLTIVRSDNSNLKREVLLDIDNCNPITSVLYIETTSFTTGILHINPVYDTLLSVDNRIIDCKANQYTKVNVDLYENTKAAIDVALTRKINNQLTSTVKVPYDTIIPTVYESSIVPNDSNTANIRLSSNYDVNVRLSCEGFENEWFGKKKIIDTTCSIKNDSLEDYNIYVRRNDIPCLYSIINRTIDSRLPVVNNCTLFIKNETGTLAGLIGDFKMPVNFDFDGASIIKGCKISEGIAQYNIENLPVYPDQLKEYNIRFYRTENHKLFIDRKIVCDTRLPKIEFIPYDDGSYIHTSGSVIRVKYKNVSKDSLYIHNAYIKCNAFENDISIGSINTLDVLETTLPENPNENPFIPGNTYNISITATRQSNPQIPNDVPLMYTTNILSFEAKNGIWLNIFGKNVSGTVYIYDGKKWRETIPYIYSNEEWIRTK